MNGLKNIGHFEDLLLSQDKNIIEKWIIDFNNKSKIF